MKLRVGVVGLGDGWDNRHRPALMALSDRFEVRAICADVALRADQAARQFDALPVDGYRALAARDDVDAVLLLAQQWYGSLPILAACEMGKAVYCATALEIEPDQARLVRERVRRSGIAFMAEFPRRQAPATLRLKELIATQLGKPQLLFCHHRVLGDRTWIQRNQNGRVVAPRDLLELVDWCRYVVGEEATSVMGVVHQPPGASRPDYEMMSLDFSPPGQTGTGPLAHLSCGQYCPAHGREAIHFRRPAEMQVICEQGVAFIDLPSTLIWFDRAGQHHESLESERPVGEQLFMLFYRAVTSLLVNTSSLEDAYRALHIVLAAKQSAAERRRVTLEF